MPLCHWTKVTSWWKSWYHSWCHSPRQWQRENYEWVWVRGANGNKIAGPNMQKNWLNSCYSFICEYIWLLHHGHAIKGSPHWQRPTDTSLTSHSVLMFDWSLSIPFNDQGTMSSPFKCSYDYRKNLFIQAHCMSFWKDVSSRATCMNVKYVALKRNYGQMSIKAVLNFDWLVKALVSLSIKMMWKILVWAHIHTSQVTPCRVRPFTGFMCFSAVFFS